jgi:hypothetical protein
VIPLFTDLLADFLVRRKVAKKAGVFLGPPDQAFVAALPAEPVCLNVYLADLRENRKLRSNERSRTRLLNNGTVREDPYPAWVDAHYLISAWDTIQDASASARNQQVALNAVSAALLTGDPFTPNTVYAPPGPDELADLLSYFGVANEAALLRLFATRLGPWPTEFQIPGLPYEVLPPSGFPNLSDFWTTMGQGSPWKPVVYLVASIPILLIQGPEYPEVTTLSTLTGQTDDAPARRLVPGTEHVWHQIGGRVLRFDGPPLDYQTVAGARVILQAPGRNPDGTPGPMLPVQDDRTDDDGRYQFVFAGETAANRLAPFTTRYQVVARYPGLQGDPLDVDLNPTTPFAHDIVLRPV